MIGYVYLALALGFVVGVDGRNRDWGDNPIARGALGWAIITALLPIFFFVYLAYRSGAPKTIVRDEAGRRIQVAPTKVCPDCAETVKGAARVCRFCRHEFSVVG